MASWQHRSPLNMCLFSDLASLGSGDLCHRGAAQRGSGVCARSLTVASFVVSRVMKELKYLPIKTIKGFGNGSVD